MATGRRRRAGSRKRTREEETEKTTTKKRRGGKKKSGSKFQYRPPSADAVKKHQRQSGADFDSYIDQNFRLFRPQEGDLCIRILPPTWDEAEYWAYPIHVHYDVGPDGATYLCRNKMLNEPCPVCEESADELANGDPEVGKDLKAKKRMLVWIVDRDNEDKGPLPWAMPWTVDRDIAKLIEDRRTGEVLMIDHPEEGYDVEFTFEKGAGNPYKAIRIARNDSPISDDPEEMEEWLDYITENPLPDLLNFYDYEHIEAVFNGTKPNKAKDEDVDEPEDEDEGEEEEEDDDDLPFDPDPEDDEGEEEEEPEQEEDPEAEEEEEETSPPPRRRRRARSRTSSSAKSSRGKGRRKLRERLKDED